MKRILAIFVCMLLALPVLGIAEETASGGDLSSAWSASRTA